MNGNTNEHEYHGNPQHICQQLLFEVVARITEFNLPIISTRAVQHHQPKA